MKEWPQRFESAAELDEFLSRPSEAVVRDLAALPGDLAILGAGGKIGPTLARMAWRAVEQAGGGKKIWAVDVAAPSGLEDTGVEPLSCDLLDRQAVAALPRAENLVFLVGRKFGSAGSEWRTWAANVLIPHHVAETFGASRAAVFSTGCVYPPAHVFSGGSIESDPPEPVGEYAISSLGRERVFDFHSVERGMRVVHLRLNYALELRYGVLADIAGRVFRGEPVEVATGFFNGIWQGDACGQALRSLHLASSPATVLNLTGPELLSVRWAARRFGELFGKPAVFRGEENGRAYLSNAAKANALFGNPSVPAGRIVEWVADWILRGCESLNKPTHFETQDGRY